MVMNRQMSQEWLRGGIATLAVFALAQSAVAQIAPELRALLGQHLVAVEAPESDFWLGIRIGSLPEVAKRQLALESGVVVPTVAWGLRSPASRLTLASKTISATRSQMYVVPRTTSNWPGKAATRSRGRLAFWRRQAVLSVVRLPSYRSTLKK